MLVLDSSGDGWMAKWKRLFAVLEIRHLRSPMFFHPDPRDRDGLLEYVHAVGRECECVEIAGCVGRELSKHQLKKRRRRGGGSERYGCFFLFFFFFFAKRLRWCLEHNIGG